MRNVKVILGELQAQHMVVERGCEGSDSEKGLRRTRPDTRT